MTEEKNDYLAKKLRKNIRKEIFSIFEWISLDHEYDKNWTFEIEWYSVDGKDGRATYAVFIGDCRVSRTKKFAFDFHIKPKKEAGLDFELYCNVSNRDYFDPYDYKVDEWSSYEIGYFILARLMHYSEKYDKKIKKQETVNEPTTN